MLVARDSRRRRRHQRADVLDQLTRIFRRLAAIASGQHRRTAKGGRRRHRTSASDERSYERTTGQRAWLVKREISAWRLGAIISVVLVFAWISWCIIAQTAALNLAQLRPQAALSFVPDHPVALIRHAQQELAEPNADLDSAQEWAQQALRSSPLHARAFTMLGLIAERKGDQKNADALMRIAAARTWRDQTADEWLLNNEAHRGDYAHALLYADALTRISYNFQPVLFPVLASFTVDPRAFEALTTFLAAAPPWRSWFLSELSARLANQTRLVQLYTALKDSKNPPTMAELGPYLDRLVKDENFQLAYRTWHATLPPPQQGADGSYPFNRDFECPIDGLPFNWNLKPIPGADVQIVSTLDGGKKPALNVEFAGSRVRFANVKQLMLLPPGDYSFSGKVKTTELRTVRGLWWRMFCADSESTIANTELVSGTMAWSEFSVQFRVPTTGCDAQWLQLELPARIEPEQRIEGEVWYQDLQITPAPAASAAAPLH